MAIKGSTDTVIHNWAHNAVIDHSNPRKSEVVESANCSRDCSGYLWSYSTRIALRLDADRFLVSSVRYSKTTAKQLSMVRRSIPGSYIEVPEIDHRWIENSNTLKYNVKHLCDEIIDASKECWKTRSDQATNAQGYAKRYFDRAQLALINYLEWFPGGREYVTLPVKSKAALAKLTPARFYGDFDKAKALSKAAAVKAAYQTKLSTWDSAKQVLKNFKASAILGKLYPKFNGPTLKEVESLLKKKPAGKSFPGYKTILRFLDVADRAIESAKQLSPGLYAGLWEFINEIKTDTNKALLDLGSAGAYPPDMGKLPTIKLVARNLASGKQVNIPTIPAEFWNRFKALPEAIASGDGWTMANYPESDFDAFIMLTQDLASELETYFEPEHKRLVGISIQEREAELAKQEAERRAKLQSKIDAWCNGSSNDRGSLYGIGILLRVKGNNVETSLGASVPVKLARYVWPKLLAYRAGLINSSSLPGQWGNYRFYPDSQPENRAFLQIGCHKLEWVEVEKIARLLDLTFRIPPYDADGMPFDGHNPENPHSILPAEISTNG